MGAVFFLTLGVVTFRVTALFMAAMDQIMRSMYIVAPMVSLPAVHVAQWHRGNMMANERVPGLVEG